MLANIKRDFSEPATTYLNAAQVRRRYGGVSDMSIWRWLRDGGFPQPLRISGRRFWLEADLTAWEQRQSHATGLPTSSDDGERPRAA
jgi:predicted DNA-binding transcriptional regulator AlpA